MLPGICAFISLFCAVSLDVVLGTVTILDGRIIVVRFLVWAGYFFFFINCPDLQ